MTAAKKVNNNNTVAAVNAEMVKALTYCGVFLGSGIANTLLVQLIYDTAKFDSRAMITNTFIFFGYAMMRFLPTPTKGTVKLRPGSAVPSSSYITLAILDAFASLLTTVGQISIGSGLFQVIFSSKIIFSALLSKFWLRRSLTPAKWASIFVIVFGLIICVYKPTSSSSSPTTPPPIVETIDSNNQLANNTSFFTGIAAVLLASFIFSASHIYSEHVMRESEVSPYGFAASYGYYSVLCCLVYLFTITLYNSQKWVITPLSHVSSSGLGILATLFGILMCTSTLRSYGIFNVLSEYGTVTMGVLYALQSIVVFFSSAMFLCDPTHPTRSGQCLTTSKLVGSMIVISGGLLYTYSSSAPIPNSNNNNNNNNNENNNIVPPSPSKTVMVKTP